MEMSMLIVSVAEELWNSRVLPEGELTRWRVADGVRVAAGQALAEVRIEDALHEITSPGDGVLLRRARVGDVIDPGSRIGWVKPVAAS
jgi:pyruvate/2-oxoglutarate dehydrogenase complex dihydrolipoamide acyltransferase (E2) component